MTASARHSLTASTKLQKSITSSSLPMCSCLTSFTSSSIRSTRFTRWKSSSKPSNKDGLKEPRTKDGSKPIWGNAEAAMTQTSSAPSLEVTASRTFIKTQFARTWSRLRGNIDGLRRTGMFKELRETSNVNTFQRLSLADCCRIQSNGD